MICALSEKEMLALQTHGLEPSCDNHPHFTKIEADRIESDQGGQWVSLSGEMRARFVRMVPRVWRARNCGMQLVPGVIQGRAGSFRYPVRACGGRNRDTSVSANNYEPAKDDARV
jgi:hypothetical protein